MIPIGLAVAPPGPDSPNAIDAFVAQARDGASEGLATGWMGQMYNVDALTALAVIADRVPSIGIGTAVSITHTRHPITMSSQAQTVQAACGGRVTLGIGVSHRRPIEVRYGIDFDRPARHMREYLSALQPLLSTGAVSYRGETLTAHTTGFSGLVGGSTPPPVLVAAFGPVMLKVAGELADGTVYKIGGAHRAAPEIVISLPV